MATNQPRTILGPLTTAVSLPASCSSAFEYCSTCDLAWRGQTCSASTNSNGATTYIVQDNTDCWPQTTSFVASPTQPLAGWGFYSPGMSCPTGMTSACAATAGGVSNWQVQFGMLGGETAVGCCPTGFTCWNNGQAQTCYTIATARSTPNTFEVLSCTSGKIGLATHVTLPQTITSTVSSSLAVVTQSYYYIYAPLIQINWQSSDRASSATSTPPPTSSPTTSGPINTSTNGSPTSSPSSSGLSAGASAGIGVGATLIVLGLIAVGFIIGKKRRNAYKQAQSTSPSETNYEMNAKSDPDPSDVPFKPYTAPGELAAYSHPAELPPTTGPPPNRPVYEM